MSDLKTMCKSFADDITNGELALSEYDFIANCLDIRYIVDSKCQYLGAQLLVSFGGPNIWIHTMDYKAVTPKDNPCFEIGIDLMKLKQLCDALPMSESKDKAVKLSFIAKQSAVLFETIHHENKIEGLIMPVRLK